MVETEAASMFAGQPQPVEIHHGGIWYSGELIGWRNEADGGVTARVRCRVDGLRHSAWMALTDLRLPDPKRPPRRESFPAVVRGPAVGGPEEADATRPHALLSAMQGRPQKPAHANRPPAPRSPLATPASGGLGDRPARPLPAEPERRTVERRKARLSPV